MPAIWNINAPNAVQLFDFRDAITKQILSNATITGRLLDHLEENEITNSSFSIPLIDAATGHYGGRSTTLTFGENVPMWLEILATISAVTVFLERFEVVAGYGPRR